MPIPFSHPRRRALAAAALLALCAGVLTACRAHQPSAYVVMDTQYYVTTAGNYFSPEAAVFTSDALHFSWQLPDQNVGYNASLLFRPVEGGLAVYYRPAYENYVVERGGVEPEGI